MVKRQNKNNVKVVINQGESGCTAKASKIGTSLRAVCSTSRKPPRMGIAVKG